MGKAHLPGRAKDKRRGNREVARGTRTQDLGKSGHMGCHFFYRYSFRWRLFNPTRCVASVAIWLGSHARRTTKPLHSILASVSSPDPRGPVHAQAWTNLTKITRSRTQRPAGRVGVPYRANNDRYEC